MTATNNLPLAPLADTVLVNYQGDTRRMLLSVLAEIIGNGGSGPNSSLAAEIEARKAADEAIMTNGGRFFTSREVAVAAGQAAIPAIVGFVITRESNGGQLVLRGPLTNTDDPLFTASPYWGVTSRIDTAAAMRDAGVMTLANVAGTANAITAELPPAAKLNGVTSTSGTSIVEIVPIATNTAAPTLAIDGGGAVAIQSEMGAELAAGQLIAGRSYLLRRRGTVWRVISGGVAMEDVSAAVAVEAQRRAADLAPLKQPFATAASDGMRATRTDSSGNAIEVWRDSGGLDFHAAPEFWARGRDGVGVTQIETRLAAPIATIGTLDGNVLRTDRDGNVIEIMRPDGLDMVMSAQFWARAGATVGTGTPALSTTEVGIIATDGQSLTVGGDYTSSVSLAYARTLRSDAALMLTGMKRGDAVDLVDVAGPRSQGYDTATPATGIARAEPPAGALALAYPVAVAINRHRADLGLPQVPVVTTSHGISGIPIEDMDASPATGAGGTVVWGNLTYWTAEARRVIEAAGKTVRQPWHVWTHGTSAKAKLRGEYAALWWTLRDATVALWQSQGVPVPRYIITQSGGDATTVGDVWAVCDDQLDICEAGGAVLATPLYWYEIADNNVHPDAESVMLFGDTYAWAMAEVEAGRRWTIARPRATWDASASVLVLDFESLREDEWLVAEDAAKYAASGGVGLGAAAYGFEAVGATITAASLRGRTVRLTCSAKPASVKYAMQVQDMSTVAGNRFDAHRGLLRTSTRKASKLVPGRMLVRAIPSFTLTIPA